MWSQHKTVETFKLFDIGVDESSCLKIRIPTASSSNTSIHYYSLDKFECIVYLAPMKLVNFDAIAIDFPSWYRAKI